VVTLALVGCAGAAARPAAPARPSGTEDGHVSRLSAPELESTALEAIAVADPRFAKRLAAPPGEDKLRRAVVTALAHGDSDVAAKDGALDFFAFTARERALDQAAKVLEAWPASAGDDTALEGELAGRLVAEERMRLREERSLPAGASALVRGIVETWGSPPRNEIPARDEWLASKLTQIRASLPSAPMTRSAIAALDGSLDPLERLALPEDLPSSARAVAELRVALGGAQEARPTAEDEGLLVARVQAHLGGNLDLKEIRARLVRAEAAWRALAKEAAGRAEERAVAKAAEPLTFEEGSCEAAAVASPIRAMRPPPERAPICGLLRALGGAKDDTGTAAAFVALHDETVVALWALALHADGWTVQRATTSAHTFYGAEPDREARLARYAEERPIAAIGAALAAEILARPSLAGAAAQTATSARWLAFGDAPLDVVERVLFTAAPSPRPPASPRP
jgi:hypothetical protein